MFFLFFFFFFLAVSQGVQPKLSHKVWLDRKALSYHSKPQSQERQLFMKKHCSLLSFWDSTKGLNIDAFPSHLSPTSCINKQEYVSEAPNLSRSGEQKCCTEHTALIPTRALQPWGLLIIQGSSLVHYRALLRGHHSYWKKVTAMGTQTTHKSNRRSPHECVDI